MSEHELSLEPEAFIASYGEGYRLLDQGPDWAHLYFTGPFQGETVVWDAHIETLTRRCRRLGSLATLRNCIEVEYDKNGRHRLNIVLNVAAINPPTLLMTIKMIRQWKRLAPGRHEYGPRHPCTG